MNFMRQAQVSAMVRNASGQREWRSLGACNDVRVETVNEGREMLAPLAPSAADITVNVTYNHTADAYRSMLQLWAAEIARRMRQELASAQERSKPKRSPNCKPAISGLTTEAPAGRYQGLGFRDGA